MQGPVCGAGTGSETAAGSTATTLMTTWTTGAVYHDGPMSAYVSSGSGASLPPSLAVSPTSLSFNASAGGTNPAPAPLSVSNVGGGSLSFTAVTDVPWLSASPTAGSAPQTLQVSVLASSLAQGSYTGHVTVTANGAQGSPTVISVSLMVTPPAPPPPAGSASDWPMVDHDPARTGDATGETAITSTAAPTLTQRWAARLDGKVTAQPAPVRRHGIMIGGQSTQVVVAATAANSIYALDAVSGTTLWRTNFGPAGRGTAPSPADSA